MVSVIIPNWNGKEFLQISLNSLEKQTFRDFETIIVDNGSTDNSVAYIKRYYPDVQVIVFEHNRGFSAAVNAGIKRSRGEYIVLLNNDTEVAPRFLEELVTALDNHPEVGFCTSKLLNFYKKDIIDSAGDCFSKYGLSFKRGSGEKDGPEFNREEYVFGACAGAAIYRRKLFDEIGMFDEDFYAYVEDVDLSFRSQLYGYKCLYVPTAVVYHMIGATSTRLQSSIRRLGVNLKNNFFVLIKNMPASILKRNLPFISLAYALTFTIFLLKGFFRPLIVLEIVSQFFRQLPVIYRKRKRIQEGRKVPDSYISSILASGYILRGIKRCIMKIRDDERS